MKTFEITEKQVNTLLSYLVTRPYQEVAVGVATLSKLPEVQSKLSLVESNERSEIVPTNPKEE